MLVDKHSLPGQQLCLYAALRGVYDNYVPYGSSLGA